MLLGMLATLSFVSTQEASAKAKIPIGSYEKIKKIYDFPQTEDYQAKDGRHFDLGIKYTVYQIAFVPIYQEGETEVVGYIDDDTYLEIPQEYMNELESENNIQFSSIANLPFWDAWGGKIIAGVVILLIIYGFIPSKKTEPIVKKNPEN